MITRRFGGCALVASLAVMGDRLAVADFPRAALEAYPIELSVVAGGSIAFAVSSDSPQIEVVIERVADPQRRIHWRGSDLLVSRHELPVDVVAGGCDWPAAVVVPTGSSWTSGLYRAEFRAGEAVTTASFIVKPAKPGVGSRVLALRPDFTIHAYNDYGGGCLYPSPLGDAVAVVSFARPTHIYAPGPPKWSEPFLELVERIIPIEYASELDLHRDAALLDPYDTLLLYGHHEYWSREMRDAVDSFVGNGGRVLVFHGNIAYWQVRVEPDGNAIRCHKSPVADPLYLGRLGQIDSRVTTVFAYPPVLDPPDRTFGLCFRHATWGVVGSAHVPAATPFGSNFPSYPNHQGFGAFRVLLPEHALFGGISASRDSLFGTAEIHGAGQSGYVVLARGEVDGANVEWIRDRVVASSASGAPRNLCVLAVAPAEQGFAAMATFDDHGSVFHGGVEGWPQAVDFEGRIVPEVARAVENLLRDAIEPRRSLLRNGGFERADGGKLVAVETSGLVTRTNSIASGRQALALRGNATDSAIARMGFTVASGVESVFVGAFVAGDREGATMSCVDSAAVVLSTWPLSGATDYAAGHVDLPRTLDRESTRRFTLVLEQRGVGELIVDQLEVIPRDRFDSECDSSSLVAQPGGARWLVLADVDGTAIELRDGSNQEVIGRGVARPLGNACFGTVIEDSRRGDMLRVVAAVSRGVEGAGSARVMSLQCSARRADETDLSTLEREMTDDLFSNGDFELVPSAAEIAVGADWSARVPHWASEPPGSARIDFEHTVHGKAALRIDASAGAARVVCPVADPLRTDRTWKFKMYVRASQPDAVRITIHAAAFGKLRTIPVASKSIELANEWVPVEFSVTPDFANDLGLHAALQGWIDLAVTSGKAWLDGVRVAEVRNR